jgi:sugar fermentation stimulation protein A
MRLISAVFVARPNRFVVRAALPDGACVDAHLPDPGRLRELLLEGARLRLRPAPEQSRRRTRYSVELVHSGGRSGTWVSLNPLRANRLAESLLTAGRVRGAGRGWPLRREVVREGSRFDFKLCCPDSKSLWVEVKSATLVEEGIARFPDAPTLRGRRHVDELAALSRAGDRAMVLFIVQRADAHAVAPHGEIDPAFARALRDARLAGVSLRAARFELDARGHARYTGALPVQKSQRAPSR